MISIKINDKTISTPKATSVADALVNQGYHNTPFAVAINQQFIPKSQYAHTLLNDNDIMDIVSPMQGG